MSLLNAIKWRFYDWLSILVIFICTEGFMPSYRGMRWIMKVAQEDKKSILKRALCYFLSQSHISEMVRDYEYFQRHIENERLTSGELDQLLSDDNFGGIPEYKNYAEILRFDGDWDAVPSRQPGLLLPLVEKAISEKRNQEISILEIGTGNGDVLRYLAVKYPDIKFTGIDFSVKNAIKKHGSIPNIKFVKGYALDILESREVSCRIVISSSTFMCFSPRELVNYLTVLRKMPCEEIILNNITLSGYQQENNAKIVSKYLHQHTWHHNYCGYLRAAGYRPVEFKFFPYQPPKSPRPDVWISLIRAKLTAC